jgi:serine/threonine protein kinase
MIDKPTKVTLNDRLTEFYAAPEQILERKPTTKIDSWAAGIIYYQLLRGCFKHPFHKMIKG